MMILFGYQGGNMSYDEACEMFSYAFSVDMVTGKVSALS